MHSNEFEKLFLVIAALLLIMVNTTGCILTDDSPAPGCKKYWGLAPTGGCFGKSIIKELKIEPSLDCVTIEANNCNGGVLNIRNRCKQALVLGNVEVSPSEYVIFDIESRQADGSYTFVAINSNFSKYIPEQDEVISVNGKLGDQDIKISYIKTSKLCD